MLHKKPSSRNIGRKVSPPQPVFMSDEQKSDYLSSLRNNRPSRPLGSRPLPTKAYSTPPPRNSAAPPALPAAEPRAILLPRYPDSENNFLTTDEQAKSVTDLPHQQHSVAAVSAPVHASISSRSPMGKPLATEPGQRFHSIRGRKVSPTMITGNPNRSSSGSYRESGAKWMERREATLLREALEDIDQESEEKRIYAAAQDEAADLVWHHLNHKGGEQDENPAYANPDIQIVGRPNSRLETGGSFRTRLGTNDGQDQVKVPPALFKSSSFSSPAPAAHKDCQHPSVSDLSGSLRNAGSIGIREPNNRPAVVVTDEFASRASTRKSSGTRKISNGSNSRGFPNAEDQIYEDSGGASLPAGKSGTSGPTVTPPLRATNRNLLRGARPLPQRAATVDSKTSKPFDQSDIYRHPPSRPGDGGGGFTPTGSRPSVEPIPEVETPPSKNGLEIRSEDIRAATSMKRRDRSPKLPTPTAVTDFPGRPIASFDPGWQPKAVSDGSGAPEAGRPGPRPITTEPMMTASAPVVPIINMHNSEESPSLMIPTINLPDDDSSLENSRSAHEEPSHVAKASESPSRPLPRPSATVPGKLPTMKNKSRLSWLKPTATAGRSTATCSSCALPISGRIVTAAGAGSLGPSLKARFHPECFTCYHCSTGLECVAFYPEPEDKRNQRFEVEAIPDSDQERELRFYCHLDFHELFSPRCKSCKTPIEGEVIVAAGAHWHAGHFFCSECGDPFNSNTPFVEKDNYAYCVSCHTRRTSARCKACKKQILDETTVQALGGHWHSDCFNCFECGGQFGDEGRFFVRDITVEATEKEKRRGLGGKIEERAVCEACEGRRLKA